MLNLLSVIKKHEREGKAMGHFNIASFDMLKAISHMAEKYDVPVVIGTSEGEMDYLGVHHTVDMMRSCNKEHGKGEYHLFLNADHTHSIEKVREAVEAGYGAVVFDASELSLEENIRKTKEAVLEAKKINKDVLVEGELGYIGKSSKVLKRIPKDVSIDPESLPTAEEAERFVKETGVDMLAPAVGNIHGMLAPSDSKSSSGMKKAKNPDLNIERIREIKEAVDVPLVLHGGSGLTDENFREAIKAGISLIHISTEIRAAWRESFEKALIDNPEEIAPYKIISPVFEKIEEVVEEKI